MRILYFTDGAGIDLLSIRSSLLRVPEVLTSVRQGQQDAKYIDLMALLSLDDFSFRSISKVQRSFLINLVQRGLHQRWVNQGFQADLIVRRMNHRSINELKSHVIASIERFHQSPLESRCLSLSSLLGQTEIFVVGPGFDEFELRLRKEVQSLSHNTKPVKVIEVIGNDPALSWFWNDVKAGFASFRAEAH